MKSKAHRLSQKYNIDPIYSADELIPENVYSDSLPQWLYAPYEYEAFMLEKLVRRKDAAKLKVGYTSFRHQVHERVIFERKSVQSGVFRFRASGAVTWTLENHAGGEFSAGDGEYEIFLPCSGTLRLTLFCTDTAADLPALLPLNYCDNWRCSFNGTDFFVPSSRKQRCDGVKNHLANEQTVRIALEYNPENYWECSCELFGFVHIYCTAGSVPELHVGESIPEILNRNSEDYEQSCEVTEIAAGHFRSKHALALRYLQVLNCDDCRVEVEAIFHSASYRGAFVLEDNGRFNAIWMQSAYTLRLCMHHFLLDGIKRDRLPWAGDLAISLLSNAYSFCDKELVRDSLSVLGAESIARAHINTLADYSLWYFICHDLYQRYWDDREFLAREYPRIVENLTLLLEMCDGNNFLTLQRPHDWIFIDWVEGGKTTALQVLFAGALRAAAALAERMNDFERSAGLVKLSAEVFKKLKHLAWNEEKQLFASTPGGKEFLRHANLLASVLDLLTAEETAAVARTLQEKTLPAVGTPYMSILEAMAIANGGNIDAALQKIDEIWGGMLEAGASTFFEGFDPQHSDSEHLRFYDRPFGCSLCHAWSSGPVFLLPWLTLGIKPVSDGFREFCTDIKTGTTASAVVPTPYGNIVIEVEAGRIVKLEHPAECTWISNYPGNAGKLRG